MAEFIRIVEVSPRDGLQNEKKFVPTEKKIELIDRLSACGFQKIEATSFVSPKWVPQMADAVQIMAGIKRIGGVRYCVLVPNLKGYDAARAAKADEVAIFASASETFSRKNINCTIAESLERFAPVAETAKKENMPIRAYISCVTDCPYEGKVAPAEIAWLAARLDKMGVNEISLGDTIGHATPQSISAMLDAVLAVLPAERLAGHYHDTNGRALDNIRVSIEKGLRTFDAATGGLGGCPFAPGAKGNVDTVEVDNFLRKMGFETGLDTAALQKTARFAIDLRS
jgi:hydroxymethylglutaryl-CoA lyase